MLPQSCGVGSTARRRQSTQSNSLPCRSAHRKILGVMTGFSRTCSENRSDTMGSVADARFPFLFPYFRLSLWTTKLGSDRMWIWLIKEQRRRRLSSFAQEDSPGNPSDVGWYIEPLAAPSVILELGAGTKAMWWKCTVSPIPRQF